VRFHYNTSLNFSEVESNPEFKGKFKMLPHVFNAESQHMVASKKIAPETLKKVLAAFEKIKASGELDKINKKYLPE
jgi:ABC-type amino acid transport substrate-binding protein